MSAIDIEGLVVQYGAARAVDGLTLHVPSGSLYGFLGPNGAGKSSTIGVVSGLVRPASGQVRVFGLDAVRDRLAIARRVGVVPQALALFGDLTVRENLRIFAGLHGLTGARASARVDHALGVAQLADRSQSRVSALSGGMARRLNLAAALLHDPELLICDEPTTGVDPQSRNHLFETIRAIHAAGRTVLYTTHYMEEVEALCDRVAIVDGGRLVAEGVLADLLRADDGHDIHVPAGVPADSLAEVVSRLPGATLERRRRSLETVFLELTGKALRDDP